MDDVLFVIDPNLGCRARRLIRAVFPRAEPVVWSRGDEGASRSLQRLLDARPRPVVISFYSDYIFSREALLRIKVPLNIHPALPALPGVGYDWVPLWEKHRTHGATLHRMNAQIDAGEIYDVIERELALGLSHAELRALNQEAALAMLERWAPVIAAARDTTAIEAALRANARALAHPGWTGEYLSRRELARLQACNSDGLASARVGLAESGCLGGRT